MNLRRMLFLGASLLGFVVVVLATPATRADDASDPDDIPFKADSVGAPDNRIGGGTRSEGGMAANVYLVAPLKTGLTTRPSPAISFVLTAPLVADQSIDVVIKNPAGAKPLLKKTLEGPQRAGLHSIDLAGAPVVELPADHDCQITILLNAGAADDAAPLGDNRFSTAFVRRIAPPADIGADHSPRALAAAGLWFDTIADLNQQIVAAPVDAHLRAQRLSLLRRGQVFLQAPRPDAKASEPANAAQAAEDKMMADFAASDAEEVKSHQ